LWIIILLQTFKCTVFICIEMYLYVVSIMKESVYFRLEKAYLDKIDKMAKKEDRSRSYVIRRLVIRGLK
jgi:hypothetical protein